jgi:hypothetical protein
MMEMFRSVCVLRRIAAAHIAADHAHTQMHPGIAHLHALFTGMLFRAFNLDLVQMTAFLRHKSLQQNGRSGANANRKNNAAPRSKSIRARGAINLEMNDRALVRRQVRTHQNDALEETSEKGMDHFRNKEEKTEPRSSL